jgi:hypothetical protein
MEIEIARHQWDEGRRALESRPAADQARMAAQVELVSAELTRRIGQVFSLTMLASAYADADRWTFELLHDALGDDVPSRPSLVTDAAFASVARRATDYAP